MSQNPSDPQGWLPDRIVAILVALAACAALAAGLVRVLEIYTRFARFERGTALLLIAFGAAMYAAYLVWNLRRGGFFILIAFGLCGFCGWYMGTMMGPMLHRSGRPTISGFDLLWLLPFVYSIGRLCGLGPRPLDSMGM